MTYTKEYGTLKAKTDIVEHILIQIDNRRDTIERYKKEEDADGFYKGQIQNYLCEIAGYEEIMKMLCK